MCEKSYNNNRALCWARWFRVHETTGFEENLSICEAKQLRRGATPSTIIIYYIEITTFNNNNHYVFKIRDSYGEGVYPPFRGELRIPIPDSGFPYPGNPP